MAELQKMESQAVRQRWRDVGAFSYAFQPIVDVRERRVVSHEALVRGASGESAWSVLRHIGQNERPAFDAASHEVALDLARRLGLVGRVNLNCSPRTFTDTEHTVAHLLEITERAGLSPGDIVLEVTEEEVIVDRAAFARVVADYRRAGVKLALDDFGAGFSGLNLLADFQPDIIKLDMHLIRDIHTHGPRQAIVRAVVLACSDLGIDVVAEGVETVAELRWCEHAGIHLFQGYLLARPAFESLPEPRFP